MLCQVVQRRAELGRYYVDTRDHYLSGRGLIQLHHTTYHPDLALVQRLPVGVHGNAQISWGYLRQTVGAIGVVPPHQLNGAGFNGQYRSEDERRTAQQRCDP